MVYKKILLAYPYHETLKSSQILKNFPLFFNSSTSIKEIETYAESKLFPGFIQSYNSFLKLFSEENFEILESLVE